MRTASLALREQHVNTGGANLVTGAAGMIGWKIAELRLERGDEVIGVDDLCASYDVRLKEWRLAHLAPFQGFHFCRADVAELGRLEAIFAGRHSAGQRPFGDVINLAATAGTRDSHVDPWAFFPSTRDRHPALAGALPPFSGKP